MLTASRTWPCSATAPWTGCCPGTPAPTTLGTHPRAYAFGDVRQLDAVTSPLLANLAPMTPVPAGVEQVAWIDVDDTIKAMHGC